MSAMEQYAAKKWFVRFFAPGTFFNEISDSEIAGPHVTDAIKMAKNCEFRYGARAYGFRFICKARKATELDSKEIFKSPMHFLGGEVLSLAEVKLKMPNKTILIANMEGNKMKHVHVADGENGWISEFATNDVHLDAAMIQSVMAETA